MDNDHKGSYTVFRAGGCNLPLNGTEEEKKYENERETIFQPVAVHMHGIGYAAGHCGGG